MKKYIKIIIISFLFLILLTIPALASSYNALADFGSDHGSPEQDGAVDFEDLMIFSQAYGSTPSDPNWNPACDICGQGSSDPDGQVDFEDLMPLAESFGEREEKEWTVMLYMAGDNNLSNQVDFDLMKIKNALILNSINSKKINIVAQADYSTKDATTRYHLTSDPSILGIFGDIEKLLPEQNMSDSQTLTNFINWAKEKFSAKHYALVLYGHGSGWRTKNLSRGILTDDTSHDIMNIAQLANALESANQRMDLVICDSCLMQMLEVVYELKYLIKNNLPDFFIASQQNVWGWSLPYYEITNYLCNNYTSTVDDLCKEIIERYIQATNCDPNWGAISAVNMNNLDLSSIEVEINNFADALFKSQYQLKIQQAKSETQTVKDEDYKNFKDLKHFAQNVINIGVSDCNNEASDIINMVNSMFPFDYEKHVNGGNVDYCHGINIVIPSDSSDYWSSYGDLNFAKNTSWDEFIKRGDKVSNIETVAITENRSGSIINAVKISWDTFEGATDYRIDRTIDGFNYETFETTETTYYDQDVQEGTGYIYYISALGPFGTTLPSDVSIIEPKFLPACSLTSPPNDPDGLNPITNPTITFQWNPPNISCPYKGIEDIDGMVLIYDITEGNEFVWYNPFKNDLYTDQVIFNGEGELIHGHSYKWLYEARGYEDFETNRKLLTISKSQEWEFTYLESPNIIEPPVEFRGGVALTLHSTRSRLITRGILNDDSSRVLYYSSNLGDTLSRGGIYHAVDVSWLAYDNCTGYRVYRSTNGSEYEMILNWDTTGIIGSAFGLYDSDIVVGNTYSYYFTAYNDTENWETVPSNIYTIEIDNETFLPPIYLNQPQDYGLVDDPNYLFKWTPVGNILPYGDVVEGQTWLRIFDADTLSSLWTPLYSDNFTTSQVTYNGDTLISGNTYRWYVRNYGFDANGQIIASSDSEDWEFTYTGSPVESPTVTTVKVTNITKTSAILYGNITNTGGENPHRRGFALQDLTDGLNLDPIYEDGSFPTGEYSLNVSNLIPGHHYRFGAYAENSHGGGYGDWIEFTADNINPPTVSNRSAINITQTSATIRGRIDANGGEDADMYRWSYREQGGDTYNIPSDIGNYPVGDYALNMNDYLSPGRTYEFSFNAKNSAGWSDNSWREFTTLPSVKELDYITVSPSYVTMHVPEMLQGDFDYIVTAHYKDGTSQVIKTINCIITSDNTDAVYVSGDIISAVCKYADSAVVTITYTENLITRTTTINVTVEQVPGSICAEIVNSSGNLVSGSNFGYVLFKKVSSSWEYLEEVGGQESIYVFVSLSAGTYKIDFYNYATYLGTKENIYLSSSEDTKVAKLIQ